MEKKIQDAGMLTSAVDVEQYIQSIRRGISQRVWKKIVGVQVGQEMNDGT